MGRMVDGRWMSEDEILDRDPVAGPLGRRFEERMARLRDDLESGYAANVAAFRERVRRRLEKEARDPGGDDGSVT